MGETPNYKWPTPEGSDKPAGHLQIKALGDGADATVKEHADKVDKMPRGVVDVYPATPAKLNGIAGWKIAFDGGKLTAPQLGRYYGLVVECRGITGTTVNPDTAVQVEFTLDGRAYWIAPYRWQWTTLAVGTTERLTYSAFTSWKLPAAQITQFKVTLGALNSAWDADEIQAFLIDQGAAK